MSDQNEGWHSRVLEKKMGLFTGLTTIVILIGGLVEIVPMYTVSANQPANADLVAPYTPLELAGRDIYVREGCYNCHSQMVRPFLAETLRYGGEWSRAGEYVHDRPFQLGSRRIGPDLHRVGGKYPDAWHYQHMLDPRSTSPGSIMPRYPWLFRRTIDPGDVAASVRAMARLAGGYESTDDASVEAAIDEQGGAIASRIVEAGFEAGSRDEIVAVIAYLQRLGTDRQLVIDGVVPEPPAADQAPASDPAAVAPAPTPAAAVAPGGSE